MAAACALLPATQPITSAPSRTQASCPLTSSCAPPLQPRWPAAAAAEAGALLGAAAAAAAATRCSRPLNASVAEPKAAAACSSRSDGCCCAPPCRAAWLTFGNSCVRAVASACTAARSPARTATPPPLVTDRRAAASSRLAGHLNAYMLFVRQSVLVSFN